ncbi:MAG: hypothetical protein RL693_1610 [Verrucomicrobiota bacterium]|jgi:hypothetical protein
MTPITLHPLGPIQIDEKSLTYPALSKCGTSIAGWIPAALFVILGIAMSLLGLRANDGKGEWVAAGFGVLMAGFGMVLLAMRTRQLLMERNRRTDMGPEGLDYPWDRTGFTVNGWFVSLYTVSLLLWATAFLAGFHYPLTQEKKPPPGFVQLILLFMEAVIALGWLNTLISILRVAWFGITKLEFEQFPYRLDAPLCVRWQCPRHLTAVASGRFILSCKHEFVEVRRRYKENTARLVHETLWSGSWELAPGTAIGKDQRVELCGELPQTLPPTCLSGERIIFWELEVRLKLRWLNFEAEYLIPIY